jgi:RND family efflux transporter MFP subunit
MKIPGYRTAKWIVGAAVIAGSTFVIGGCGAKEDSGEKEGKSEARTVNASVATVSETTVPNWLEATGVVRSKFDASLSAKVMGRVRTVAVREGDSVRKGQLLVELDASDLSAAVDVARANLRSAAVGLDSTKTAVRMEDSSSSARIAQANAGLAQARAAVETAKARLQLAQAGPRTQEKAQAKLAVRQAEANLKLAAADFGRIKSLFDQEAVSRRQFETAQAQLEVAQAQYETAKEAESIAQEGTRTEDLRAAQEGVRQAQAAYKVAEAGVQQAKASALQTDMRRQEVQAARAQISQSRASLNMAQTTRGFAEVRAPFDGVVNARMVDPGAMAGPGSPLLSIQGGDLRLEAVVPESALNHVKLKTRVDVELDALPGQTFGGTVVEIRPQGDLATHTFLVRISLDKSAGVMAGMFGRAKVATGSAKQVLIPASATWERDGLHYVFVVDSDNVAQLRIVTLGTPDGQSVVVLSGLSTGEKIVVGDRENVKEGDKIGGGN